MVLTYDAYIETLDNQKEKDDKIVAIEKTLELQSSQLRALITAVGNIKDQNHANNVARTLYDSGILIKAKRWYLKSYETLYQCDIGDDSIHPSELINVTKDRCVDF